jgi:hypothetical protein
MPSRSSATTIDEYIEEFPPDTRKVLEEMRALIRASAPDATETISYAIPTFDLKRHLVIWDTSIVGFYPTGAGPLPRGRDRGVQEREGFVVPRRPIPADLIGRISNSSGAVAGKALTLRGRLGPGRPPDSVG